MNNNNFDDVYGSFGVTAYAYRGKWADGREKSVYIDDKEAVGENGAYDFSPSVFWPGEEFNMAFFAYAPYGFIDPDGVDEDGFPKFRYTVPEKIEDQKDLWHGGVLTIPAARPARREQTPLTLTSGTSAPR